MVTVASVVPTLEQRLERWLFTPSDRPGGYSGLGDWTRER
ncbi:hypothetical protein NJ7G_2443 [Natrinema sp. J7-2]|nr:hypothetical protein NJ7G_2443 [Natrinema sp. J7-2]